MSYRGVAPPTPHPQTFSMLPPSPFQTVVLRGNQEEKATL